MSTKSITSRNEEGITCEVDHSGGDDGGSGSPFVCLFVVTVVVEILCSLHWPGTHK